MTVPSAGPQQTVDLVQLDDRIVKLTLVIERRGLVVVRFLVVVAGLAIIVVKRCAWSGGPTWVLWQYMGWDESVEVAVFILWSSCYHLN